MDMKFCSHCGSPLGDQSDWPKKCPACAREHFRNPYPVSVVLLPVDDGVLTVRRAINPQKDKLALPGGYVEWGESWRDAAARELWEETGIRVDARELSLLKVESVPEGAMIFFTQAPSRSFKDLSINHDPVEVHEVVIVKEPCPLAFSSHTEVVAEYFRTR